MANAKPFWGEKAKVANGLSKQSTSEPSKANGMINELPQANEMAHAATDCQAYMWPI